MTFLPLLLLALPSFQALANDTITVAPHLYHIDQKKKLIVVNQNLAELNGQSGTSKTELLLDKAYRFARPTPSVQTTASYEVMAAGQTYTVYFSQLPVVHVAARRPIVDTPSTYARFSMAEPDGRLATANMGIEVRGGSSQGFAKKSFELSFWADTVGAIDRDMQFLDMRTDNKWNLQAMTNEPLRVRSKTANQLWQDIHTLYYQAAEPEAINGIWMSYVEVFVNDEYRGIYALSERVDRKQLKLKKYNNAITGELYKGADWGGAVSFSNLPPYTNPVVPPEDEDAYWGGFEYKHPEEKVDWAALYDFVAFVENSSDVDFNRSYAQKFHLGNAVDYYIFLNLMRATDNWGKNLYIAKYKQGEPYYYVPWDLDGVMGLNWLGLDAGTTGLISNGFYDRLLRDCAPGGFRATLASRWTELRSTVVTERHIMGLLRTNADALQSNNVYDREQRAWAGFTADTTQLTYMAVWLRDRLSYLDQTLAQPCAVLASSQAGGASNGISFYPNPVTDYVTIEAGGAGARVVIQNMQGKNMLTAELPSGQDKLNVTQLTQGLYIITIETRQAKMVSKLLVN